MTDGATAHKLDVGALRRRCRVEDLGFSSTADVEPLDGTVGQARAHEAIAFGLDAQTDGYNIFATGPAGTGKRTSLESLLNEHARSRPAGGDLVYVYNFRDPKRPIAIELPSGQGAGLAADMRTFLEDARRDLVAAFESEAYSRRRREAVEPLEREQETAERDQELAEREQEQAEQEQELAAPPSQAPSSPAPTPQGREKQ